MEKWRLNLKALSHDPLTWITIFLLFLYMLIIALRPPEIFWSLDEGGKFIYLQNVIRSGNPAAPLAYPGQDIDPHAKFIPLYFHIQISETEIYSWWPVGFPLLTIPFYLVFGWLGLYVLPAACGAGASLFAGLIIRRLIAPARSLDLAAAALVGITTPVFYYSTMFWEHTLSTFFFLGSVFCLIIGYQEHTPKFHWWILSGGLVSISAFFRTDSLPLAIGIGLIILLTRFPWALAYGGGFIVTSLPWLLFNKLVMGNFLSRQIPDMYAQGWFVGFRTAGIKFIPYALFNAPMVQALPIGKNLLILGCICVLVAVTAPFFKRFQWAALAAYLGLLSISAWALFHPWGYRSVHGFILIAPQVIFAVWFWVNGEFKKPSFLQLAFLSGFVVFAIVYLLKMWVAGGGQQWGPRYQLAMYPLLVITALIGIFENWNYFTKYFKVGIVMLYIMQSAVGLGFEIRGEIWAQKAAEYYDISRKAINELQKIPITTNCTFLPMILPEYYEQGNMFNRAGMDLKVWADAVKSHGVGEFYNIDVDMCSYDHLDAVVENRKKNPTGLIINKYNILELVK